APRVGPGPRGGVPVVGTAAGHAHPRGRGEGHRAGHGRPGRGGRLVVGPPPGVRRGVRSSGYPRVRLSAGGLMGSAERAMGRLTARRGERILGWLSVGSLATAALFALVITPREAVQGNVFRLIYLHVPTAWLAYLAFFVVLVGSIGYLVTRKIRWDRLAAASAEIGVLF